jgi:hypothetical protein
VKTARDVRLVAGFSRWRIAAHPASTRGGVAVHEGRALTTKTLPVNSVQRNSRPTNRCTFTLTSSVHTQLHIHSNPSKCSSTKTPPLCVLPYPSLSLTQITPQLTPHQLIAQCTSHFKIANDTASLVRINDSLSTLSQFRSQHLQSLQSTLTQLNRTHQTLAANHSHTLSQHNPTNHAAEILRLDTEKFKIAKQASDLEIEGERLAQEVGRLGGIEAELEAEGVEGGEREKSPSEDATVYVSVFSLFLSLPLFFTCFSSVANARWLTVVSTG